MTSQNRFVEFVSNDLISHGPIADVYLGNSNTSGTKVALKLFSLARSVDSNSNTSSVSSHFDTELGILLDNNCPNIGRILTFGTTLDGQHQYLALEFVSGVHLDRAAKDSSHEALLNLFLQVAHALSHLHNRGFVHGDLKPTNVLVTLGTQLTVTLIDFGAAGNSSLPLSPIAPCLTVPYAAPELLRHGIPTIASDLYAMGMMIQECIIGVSPDARAQSHYGPSVESQGTERGPLDTDLLKLAQRLLSPHPSSRPISIDEVIRAITALAAQHAVPLWGRRESHRHLELFPLVERENQARLTATIGERLIEGQHLRRPVFLEITGPSGTGKSRLMRHLARVLLGKGVCVFQAQDLSVLESFASSPRASNGRRWALLVDVAAQEQGRSLRTLQRLLESDLPPQLLVVSTRSDSDDSDLEGSLASLRQTTEHQFLPTCPLSPASLLECLKTALHMRTVPSDLVDHLHASTGGIPSLAWLYLQSLFESGAIRRSPDGTSFQCPTEHTVPTGVRPFLAAALESLPEEAHDVVNFLAAARAPLNTHVLSLLTTLSSESIAAHIESLVRRGVVRYLNSDARALTMPELVARYVETEQLSEQKRAALHMQLARVLSSPDASPLDLKRAASHYAAAGLKDNAFALFLRAGGLLLESGQPAESAASYRGALSLNVGDAVTRAMAQLHLCQALEKSGLFRDAGQLLSTLSDAPTWPPHLRLNYLLARSRCHFDLGDYRTSTRTATDALRLAREQRRTNSRIEALLILGAGLCWLERRRQGVKMLLTANALARRTGQLPLAVDALRSIASSHWKSGHYRLARRYERRRFVLLSRTIESVPASFALMNMAIIESDLGHFNTSRVLCRQAKRLRGDKTSPNVAGALLINLGESFRAQGQWPVVVKANTLAIGKLQQSGELHRVYVGESNISRVLSTAGYISEAHRLLSHRLNLPVVQSSASIQLLYLVGWGQLHTSAGSFSVAHRILSRACELAHEKRLHSLILECKSYMAYCLLEVGSHENAIALVDKALLEHGKRSPFEAVQTAKVFRLLASVRLGRNLEGHLQASMKQISLLRKKGMLWHLSTSLMTYAEALLSLQRGAEGEEPLREVVDLSRKIRDRMLYWRSQYLLGRISEQALRNEQALRRYRRAAHTVQEIAQDIEEDRLRDAFLGQPEVRDLLSRFERLGREVGRKARHDVALLKRNEMISRKMLASLSAIGQQLSSILDLNKLLASILDLAIDNVRAERGVVYLKDEATGSMRPESARGVDGRDLDDLSSFSRSVIERAAQGQTILTVDVGQDPTLSAYQSLIVHEVKSILCVPMRARGNVVGLVYLDTRKTQQMFTDKERTFIESFASQAAIAIENARLFGAMRDENTRLRREVEGRFKELVGGSAAMRRLRDTIAGILETDCTVLVTGESGTGKELVARALHYNSARREGRFVPIDCGALPEHLLEAELFGYCRGAFTGADRDRVGLIEEASGGTLFLDEITNTSLALQARLLRVLQEREIRRIGENQTRKVDVRVIAATNADLVALMAQNRFRRDLYYRLNVVSIEVPPLRDRMEDIPALVDCILARQAKPDRRARRLAPGVLETLGRHNWPGNIRELENVLERAAILGSGEWITLEELPGALQPAGGGRHEGADAGSRRAGGSIFSPKTGEQAMIEEALRRFAGDKSRAARYIGWNRQKLYRRMRTYRIPPGYGKAA